MNTNIYYGYLHSEFCVILQPMTVLIWQLFITVARVAENNPKNPISGFDLALSVLKGAMKLNSNNIMVLRIRVPVMASLLFSISHAGVFDTNIPTYLGWVIYRLNEILFYWTLYNLYTYEYFSTYL